MAEKRKAYQSDKAPINLSQSDEKAPESEAKGEMVTFSIRLPAEQKRRLEAYLAREKGIGLSPFVRQLITEYMRENRVW
jgi:hypothetical protein